MKDFRKLLSERVDDFTGTRLLNQIKVGGYELSIQASNFHYCTPRTDLPLDEYEEMELAIFKNDKWVQPRNDNKIKSFPRYEELINLYEDGDIAVGGYIPIDLIQDLCNYLEVA